MEDIKLVGVVGSGTMGAGIAQLMIQNGYSAVLFDLEEETVERAKAAIFSRIDRFIQKQKKGFEEAEKAKSLLRTTTSLRDFEGCQLVIEAVPENIEIKRSVFKQLEDVCAEDAILATNTSSISITQISSMIQRSERVAGFHFFNPAPIMPLVEVIQGLKTSTETVEALRDFAEDLKKTPVLCKDTPGFIVNRVARPFYNEAIRLMNDQVASVEQIDRIMKKAGNFKMGPFELQDLIGIDINFATTNSVHDSFHGESRFRPHYYQERMVQSGNLGRKTGGGYFSYDDH